ncbi:hypothetical protein [Actinoplanes sp. CA-252034]|uniref:hypothetical protein n=1 Tax=Actinoplanes sp. CA-252034 TaxID=3239906 RepID=UPI003D960300
MTATPTLSKVTPVDGLGASGVDGTDPWWQRVDEAAQLLVSTVNAAAAKAGKDGVYTPPPGRPDPRRRRRPPSLRHLAEVIRTRRLTAAVEHLTILIAQAREADVRAPALLPVPRASAGLIVDARPVPRPSQRRRRVPVRGVAMVGALAAVAGGLAWRSPGRWRIADGPWHSCASPLPLAERGYVHSPAVSTTIGGQPVTIQVCLWRDDPNRENCTTEIATGCLSTIRVHELSCSVIGVRGVPVTARGDRDGGALVPALLPADVARFARRSPGFTENDLTTTAAVRTRTRRMP